MRQRKLAHADVMRAAFALLDQRLELAQQDVVVTEGIA